MSYLDVIEKEITDREKEEAEIQMSNDHQKEIDEENAIVGELKEIIKKLTTSQTLDIFVDLLNEIVDAKVGTKIEEKDGGNENE